MSSGWQDSSKSGSGSSHKGRSGEPGLPPVGGAPSPPGEHGITKGRGGKAVVAAIIVIVAIVFVIGNLNRVRVNFIITSGHPRMIWLIVGCLLIGGITGYFLGRPGRARRRHEEG